MNLIKNVLFNPIMDFIYDINSYTLSDDRHVKRNTLIQVLIATIAFIMLVRVYPMGILQNHEYSKQQAFDVSARAELTGDSFGSKDKKLQTVYFSNEHIYQMTLYMECVPADKESGAEKILFRIYDDKFSCIYEEEYTCSKIIKDGYLRATPDMDVTIDSTYYYEIIIPEGIKSQFMLPIADRSALAQTENSTLYIDGIINDEVCLIADFDYTMPLSALNIIFYYMLIILAAVAVYLVVMWIIIFIEEHFDVDGTQKNKYLRILATLITIISGMFVFVYSVILNKFGSPWLDRAFYIVAILAGGGWVLAYIWLPVRFPRAKKTSKLPVSRRMSLIWRNYIQIVCFGLLFYALCQYTNADREYYHYTNTRWMLIFLAIALLMTYTEKQFINKINAIWLLLGSIGSFLYCRNVTGDEKELLLARLTCGVIVAWGMLIINILMHLNISVNMEALKKENLKNTICTYAKNNVLKIVYCLLWIVFCLFMYFYRFEKVWVFTATLPFFSMMFLRITDASKSRFLKNLTDGILLSFLLVVVFCLIHRPHHYWMLYRYAGIFHTVACTGMYLVVVLGAAVAKLYARLKDDSRIFSHCYGEYFIVAVTAGFIILTMARTAFLTSSVLIFLVTILTAVTYKKNIKRILKETAILAVTIVLTFPLVFTAVRMVPAVVNDPVRYDLEFQDDSFMICKGDPIDSDKYMTVERFFTVMFGRFDTQEEDNGDDEQSLEDGKLKITHTQLLVYNTNALKEKMLAKASNDESEETESEEAKDISNGRFEIFTEYIKNLEIKGHEKMSPLNSKGEGYAHAHNSYLQVAYNFGIIAGVVFLMICALTLWKSVSLFYKMGDKYSSYLLPFSLVIVFGFVSLTEWAFHPCIPAGFAFLVVQAVLIRD